MSGRGVGFKKGSVEKTLEKIDSFVNEAKETLGFPIVPDGKTGAAVWYSQRELRLRYLVSVEKVRRFFERLSEGKLSATRCGSCNDLFFPPQSFCPRCGAEDLDWVDLPDEGVLLTFTKIVVKPLSFSHYDDYIVGVVKLPGGVNVVSWVRGPLEKLRVGARVRLKVVRREPEGYLTYEFEVVDD